MDALRKAAEQEQEPVAITWELNGDKGCGYNNWLGTTPFGRILITWKGWKEHHDACVDEFPGGFNSAGEPEDVKAACEAEYIRRLGHTHPPRREQEPGFWGRAAARMLAERDELRAEVERLREMAGKWESLFQAQARLSEVAQERADRAGAEVARLRENQRTLEFLLHQEMEKIERLRNALKDVTVYGDRQSVQIARAALARKETK
jgi:hypothetical protein